VSDDTHVLRVILVTQDDPFYLPHFFEPLKAALDRHPDISVRGIVIQRPLGARSTSELARQMLDFYGPVGFVRMGTRFVWRKAMAIVAVRGFGGRLPGAYSLEHLARRVGWPVLAATDVNSPAFLATIREQQIDLVVSVGASQKFKRPVLEAPRFGCINLHNSKLPRLRGMLPTFWALFEYDRDPTSALTVFKMTEDLDAGPLVLQREFALDPAEPLDRLIKRTKGLGAELVVDAIALYRHGEPPLTPMDPALATYKSFPKKQDVDAFRARGYRIL
jgi:methionyl-tRNA formyltransferase